MNTIKVSVLLIVIIFVVAGCNYTSKPRTVDSEQARLYPRVPYEAIKDNKDSLDFILSLKGFSEELSNDKKPYQLSVAEMKMAKKILEKYVANGRDHLVVGSKDGTKSGKEVCDEMNETNPLPLTHYYKHPLAE